MNQQCALVAKKGNGILGSLKKKHGQQVKGGDPPSVLVRPHLECCVQFWAPQYKKTGIIKRVQWNTTEMIKGLEHLLYKKSGTLQPGEEETERGFHDCL